MRSMIVASYHWSVVAMRIVFNFCFVCFLFQVEKKQGWKIAKAPQDQEGSCQDWCPGNVQKYGRKRPFLEVHSNYIPKLKNFSFVWL
jgi:hypothetical protein